MEVQQHIMLLVRLTWKVIEKKASAEKALYYYQLAAVGGNVGGRVNLGFMAQKSGDMKRAVKHYMISAGYGEDFSLEKIRELHIQGHATK